MAILFFIIIISLLVFVHEWGHFFVARRVGVAVEEFGFGFPPRLWSRRSRGTRWSINLIPFGGFVRLQGEHEDAAQRPDSFMAASAGKKLMVLSAGVLMNYLLAWLLLTGVLTAGVNSTLDNVPADRWHSFVARQTWLSIGADSPAGAAGLKTGDHLIGVNGQVFSSTQDLINYVQGHGYPPLTIDFERSGLVQHAAVSPGSPLDGRPRYGLGIETVGRLSYPWYVAPWFGFQTVVRVTSQTFVGLGQMVTALVTEGRLSADVTGPVGIAILTNQITDLGLTALIQFTAIISISLAVLNFLPVPALDGGRVLFVVIAAWLRRPINRRLEATIHAASFYALLLAIVLISIRDVKRFEVIDRLRHFFE